MDSGLLLMGLHRSDERRGGCAHGPGDRCSVGLVAGGDQHGPTETAEGRHDRLGCGQLFYGCAHECGWPGRVCADT